MKREAVVQCCPCTTKALDEFVNGKRDGESQPPQPAPLRQALIDLIAAAECIRHWHDSGNDGMVQGGEE